MSERPTPETDEAQHEGLLRGNPMPTQVVHVNFARRLERERDEALNAIHTYKCEVEAWEILAKARRERDEARDIGEKLSKQGLEMMDENRTLKRERDEWAAMCGRYKQERDELLKKTK